MAMFDNLKIPKYPMYTDGDSADFKIKFLRVARLRSRARDMLRDWQIKS